MVRTKENLICDAHPDCHDWGDEVSQSCVCSTVQATKFMIKGSFVLSFLVFSIRGCY